MNLKSKAFRDLKSEWDKKLKDSGFKDIEHPDGRLELWTTEFFRNRLNKFGAAFQESKQEYYRLAGQFLYDHPFADDLERSIWELHSEGLSIRDITKALKDKGVKTYRRSVHETLQKLTKTMIRRYATESDQEI